MATGRKLSVAISNAVNVIKPIAALPSPPPLLQLRTAATNVPTYTYHFNGMTVSMLYLLPTYLRNGGSGRHAKQQRFHPDISPSPQQQPPCCSNNSSLSGLQPPPVTVATTFVPSVGGGGGSSSTSIARATLNTSPPRIDSRWMHRQQQYQV